MSFLIKRVSWQQARKQIKELRTKVFICEYHISAAIEFDQLDQEANHLLMINQDQVAIATGRINPCGRVSRIAILDSYRNPEIIEQLMNAIKDIALDMGLSHVSLNCELADIAHFEQAGYHRKGGVFMEGGIAKQTFACATEKLVAVNCPQDPLIH